MQTTQTNAEAETAQASRREKIHSFLVENMEKISRTKSDLAVLTWWDVETHPDGIFVITTESPKYVYGAVLAVHNMLEKYIPFIEVATQSEYLGESKVTQFYISAL